jgi:hypothetical protein
MSESLAQTNIKNSRRCYQLTNYCSTYLILFSCASYFYDKKKRNRHLGIINMCDMIRNYKLQPPAARAARRQTELLDYKI